ncbi:N-acetylglucosamine kinase [Phytoactinopolyspora alkaliphila]|uniref:N-acetylglucosamine kinase n=1 Tax=Phytoactinopolyspora alkaliphila TaxID=1783498 RepID=UPI001C20918B
MTIAGIDIGGGGIRVRIESGENSTRHDDTSPVPRANGQVDVSRLAPRIVAAVNAATASAAEVFDAVAIGMTGIPGLDDAPAQLSKALRTEIRTAAVVVAGDALTTHIGSLGYRAGAVVAAGTGAIALGTDFDRIWRQADGWGYALGDDGGGAWIGSRGLRAALRAHDGRPGGSADLLGRLCETFGHPAELVARTYEAPSPAHLLARFAPIVADAARAGDGAAAAIWRDAGRHLAEAATAAAFGPEPWVSWGGRLFDAGSLLLDPFTATVGELAPKARIVAPRGSSADGALTLARRAARRELAHRPPHLHLMTDE